MLRVYRAVHFEDHRVAACKVVRLTTETTQYQRKMLDKEMRVHTALKHANVLEFIGAVTVEPNKGSPYFPAVYMLLELAAGGDLFDKIAPDLGVSDDIAHYYFSQLVAGLIYVHGEGVCHRDLKPENLLLDAAGILKITDFGLCSVYKLKETGQTRLLSERCGSLPYIAPELSGDEPYEAEPIDVWGCGVILFTLCAGNTPWDQPTKRSNEYVRYLSGKCFNEDPWTRFSEDVLSLLTGMLDIKPSRRMTLAEVVEHRWMARPSQIASQGPAVLAQHLTESLRQSGDLDIADPDLSARDSPDEEGIMSEVTHQRTQFTQSLLLFSQTQSGRRYTPHLTRFYTAIGPRLLLPLIEEALEALGVQRKPAIEADEKSGDPLLRMRIGGIDKRSLKYKGWIEIDTFCYGDKDGAFVVMQRDEGNPITWRQLWKAVIMHPAVEPHVYRKRDNTTE
ncbi:Pkinase-domain-containing protein [Obba rivulosa]|uniref:non-specific serine/threonine protein kinase n=1 Tax=Obba rivulosa TaxID=1052685 RepID=A0A8E2DMZ1_9APHY|nr:Pkinase-domain-containing protein [Obba rivulosa]